MQYLRKPVGERPARLAGHQWRVHSDHRWHTHREPQTPWLQLLLNPWLPPLQEILFQKKEWKKSKKKKRCYTFLGNTAFSFRWAKKHLNTKDKKQILWMLSSGENAQKENNLKRIGHSGRFSVQTVFLFRLKWNFLRNPSLDYLSYVFFRNSTAVLKPTATAHLLHLWKTVDRSASATAITKAQCRAAVRCYNDIVFFLHQNHRRRG